MHGSAVIVPLAAAGDVVLANWCCMLLLLTVLSLPFHDTDKSTGRSTVHISGVTDFVASSSYRC